MNEPQNTTDLTKIIPALVKAAQGIGWISPDKRNDFHRYDYASASKIVGEVRDALLANGIMVMPTVVTRDTMEAKDGRGKVISVTYVELLVRFIHISGQSIHAVFHGEGQDNGDKSFYKAYTGALKYALLQTLMIPTGDDPEEDQGKSDRSEPRGNYNQSKAKKTSQKTSQKTSSGSYGAESLKGQHARFDHLCGEIKFTDQAKKEILMVNLAAELTDHTPNRMSDITLSMATAVNDWLECWKAQGATKSERANEIRQKLKTYSQEG